MGFSAGAVLAAMYLVEKQRQDDKVPFKCGVFLSSASSAAEMGQLCHNDAQRDLIRIPTAHIWGSSDQTAPTGGEDLSRLCDPSARHTLIHEGGHEIPRKGYLTDAVHVIRRTIYLASHSE